MPLIKQATAKTYFRHLEQHTGASGKIRIIKTATQPIGVNPKGKTLMNEVAHTYNLILFAKPFGKREDTQEYIEELQENTPVDSFGLDVITYLSNEATNYYKSTEKDPKEYSITEIHVGKHIDFVRVYYDNLPMREFIAPNIDRTKISHEEFMVYYRQFLLLSLTWIEDNNIEKGKLLG